MSRYQLHNEQESLNSYSSGERGPASPPYQVQTLPPYRSQPTSQAEGSSGSHDKGKQRTSPENPATPPVEPRATVTGSQGPRIALTDPLGDLRHDIITQHNQRTDLPSLKFDHAFPGAASRPPFSRRTSEASSYDDGEDDYFDEFDWSEDEQEQVAAREEEKQLQAIALRRKRVSPFSVIKWLATTFLGNFIISATLVVPAIVLQFVYRDEGPDSDRAHRDYVTDNVQAWFIWAAFNLHVEWWIHLMVELLPRLISALVILVWGSVSQKLLSFLEMFNAIKWYIKLIAYAALSWGSWAIIFNSIYHLYTRTNPQVESRATYLYRIYQVIEFFFFFTLTIAAEKILVKIISIRFHRTAYSERITKITRSLRVFDQLKERRPKLADKPASSPFAFRSTPRAARTPVSFVTARADGGTHTEPITPADQIFDGSKRSRSGQSTPKKGIFGRKTHAKKRPQEPGFFDEKHDMPLRPIVDPNGQDSASVKSSRSKRTLKATKARAAQATSLARRAMVDPTHLLTDETVGVGLDVNSPSEARRLARTLFRAYRGRHKRSYLIPEDFHVAFPTTAEANEAFEVFDSDRNGDISMTEMRNTIVEVYKERRFVAKSLEDTSSALGQLDFIFLIIAFVIIAFEAFAIFDIDISKTLTTFYTLAIGASFIFKESAQEIFDSIIFLFVTHPFDTGDRICVDDSVMVVQKMSLLSSQFLLWDNTQIFINNALLSTKFIMNYRRSGYQWECVTMHVAFDTPLEKLDAAQADLTHWLQTEPDRMFEPSTAIVPQTIDYMRSIKVTIGMTHRANWQDWGGRWYRRNCFFAACCYYFRKHGIRYMNSVQPIVYWDPPSYESTEARRGSTQASAGEDGSQDQGTAGGETSLSGWWRGLRADSEAQRERRPSLATTTGEAEGTITGVSASGTYDADDEPLPNDDFTRIAEHDGAEHMHAGKPKTFMGFVPPSDEIEGTALRRRKARRKNLMQGGGAGDGA